MSYQIHFFATPNGSPIKAKDTDQSGQKGAGDIRTIGGGTTVVVSAGKWFYSQLRYATFQRALEEAGRKAAELQCNYSPIKLCAKPAKLAPKTLGLSKADSDFAWDMVLANTDI